LLFFSFVLVEVVSERNPQEIVIRKPNTRKQIPVYLVVIF